MKKRECDDHDVYEGTRQELIEAGVVQPHQFPGEPGAGKTMTTYVYNVRKPRGCSSPMFCPGYLHVMPMARGLFRAFVGLPEEDRPARKQSLENARAIREQAMLAQSIMQGRATASSRWPWPPGHFGKVFPHHAFLLKQHIRNEQQAARAGRTS